MDTERPDPDALLARVKEDEERERRGRLKIFFGAAAGVGKTYAMLEAARDHRLHDGDVVVGWVETHGRAETQALLEGLEILPPRVLEYRGTTLREFDLDAALARGPALLLVDELAHTNAAGSRHARRWQDVVELLDAGIDVWTTMNVQHVESLNDVVAKITGVVVRETVPDALLERAEEIALIDLPPDDLLQRLKEGKVYVAEQAQEAVQHFFRRGNLIALRELALRATADRVDAEMRVYRREQAIQQIWPAAERLLVCVGPSPYATRLVRAAKRLAERLEAEWIAAWVETPAQLRLPPEARARIVKALRLAEELGAKTVTLSGQKMSEAIVAYARGHNVTKVILGKPTRSLWKRIIAGSIVDALVESPADIDVYVISGERDDAASAPLPRPRRAAEWRGYAEAGFIVSLATAVAWLMTPFFELSNVVMAYLLAVIVVATRHGRGPSSVAAILSVAAFDFFFVPPYLTFAVSDTEYLVTFAVMLLVAFVIGGLTVRMRMQAEAAREREQRTAALYAMSRDMASTRGIDQLASIAVRHIGEVFRAEVAVLVPDQTRQLQPRGGPPQLAMPANEAAVARWVYEHRQPAGLGTATLPGARALYLPLISPGGPVGVIGIRPLDPETLETPDQRHQLETFANQTALALERARLADEAQQTEIQIETERLRSSLLSSVSHDLRTPLSTITGAVGTVLEGPARLDPDTQELLQSVREEAERLNHLVQDLLDMTRLESGALQPRRAWHSLEDILGAALGRLEKRLAGRDVRIRIPPDLPLVPVDDVLLEQVFLNLLDNALRYTPPGSPISISAVADEDAIRVEVADRGPGLARGEEDRVFEKFFRGGPRPGQGAGLGLAICDGIIRAHGGRIRAHNLPEGGVAFFFTIPLGETPPTAAPPDA
jgi:two-component system sensor histidine kinase KdpD